MINISIADILPHKPPMILVDAVATFRKDFIHTTLTIKKGIPFYIDGKVPSYVSIEYMAQSIGAWRGLLALEEKKPPQIGFLLGTRKLHLGVPFFEEGDTLDIYGDASYSDGEIASFKCWVERDNDLVASASLNVFQPNDAAAFMSNHKDIL